jgi:guanylate kinase
MIGPLLIVLSGPSGVGKDAVLSRMRELSRPYHFTVTATTRPKRANERDGFHYSFLSKGAFQSMIDNGELLEWAEVYGNYYGVPKDQVVQALDSGSDVIIKADVQGAESIKSIAPEAVCIFLSASPEELKTRLMERMTESEEAFGIRVETAERESRESYKFDYVVINHTGRLDDTVSEIQRIIEDEKRRRPRRIIKL